MTTAPAPGGRRLHPALLTGIIGLLIALVLLRQVWMDPASRRTAGNDNDIDLYTWWLQHTASSLFHGRELFVTAQLNDPAGVNAMWNTAVILPGILLSPITLIFGSLATYNLLLLLGFAGTSCTAHLLVQRFVARASVARFGALIWAFCPATLASEVGHLSLVLTALVPLILICIDEVARGTRSPRRLGLALGVLVAAQLLTGEEILFETGLLVILLAVLAALLAPRQALVALPRFAAAAPLGLLAFVVIAGYPLYIQFFGPLGQHGSPFLTDYYVSDAKAFVTPSGQFLVANSAQSDFASMFDGGATEYLAYVGIPLIACTAATAYALRGVRIVTILTFAALILGVASLGSQLLINGVRPGVHLPWGWLDGLPVIENALPDRLMLMVDLCLAGLLAICLDRLVLPARVVARSAGLGVVAVVIVSLLPHTYVSDRVAPVPGWFTHASSEVASGTRVLVLPYPTPTETDPMRWQSAAHMRFGMPGGYFIGPASGGHAYVSGPGPLATAALFTTITTSGTAPALDATVRLDFAHDLATWGVSSIVVGPSAHSDVLAATVSALTGRVPEVVRGVDVWPLSASRPPRPGDHAAS